MLERGNRKGQAASGEELQPIVLQLHRTDNRWVPGQVRNSGGAHCVEVKILRPSGQLFQHPPARGQGKGNPHHIQVDHELKVTNELESELLKAQEILNTNNTKKMELEIRENEYTSRKLEQPWFFILLVLGSKYQLPLFSPSTEETLKVDTKSCIVSSA